METKVNMPKIRRSTHRMPSQTITTTDLLDIQPIFSRAVLPDDSWNIKLDQLNRCAPMPYSSFVQIKNRVAAFFVKNSQIWKPFDSFATGTPYAFPSGESWTPTNNVPYNIPYVTPLDIERLLNFPALVVPTDITNRIQDQTDLDRLIEDHEFDFYSLYVTMQDDQPVLSSAYGRTLTTAGRYVYKTLYSLGYRVPLVSYGGNRDLSGTNNNFIVQMNKIHMSLLPLMAYLSIRVNYYTPVKFRDYKYMNSLTYLVNPWIFRATAPWQNPSRSSADFGLLGFIVETILNVYYGEDYFTSALISPLKRQGGTVTSTTDPYIGNEGFYLDATGDPVGIAKDAAVVGDSMFTEYLLNVLKTQTAFNQLNALTQNDIVGATTAKLGYKPEAADMVPFLLTHENDFIKVSPILNMADTDQQDLGYKAGTADGQIHMKLNHKFDTFGQLIFVSSVSPVPMYTNGIHRELLTTRKENFYNRFNTNAGFQATAKVELDININPLVVEDTFGFREQYAEYGAPRDILSGDFVIPTRNRTLDAMHFNRNNVPVVNDLSFALARYFYDDGNTFGLISHNQYDRVFVVEDDGVEHIEQWNIFDVQATRNIAESGDYTIGDDYNGKRVQNKGISKTENM